ncbi:Fc.00g062220.m01.CDS01 [Cosmosporella sp. VM-42]
MPALLSVVEWVKSNTLVLHEHLTNTTTYEAYRCGIYVTVREVSPLVSGGFYYEEVLQEHSNLEDLADFGLKGFVNPGALSRSSLLFKPSPNATSPNQNSTFTMQWVSWRMLSSLLIDQPDMLNGNASFGGSSDLGDPDTITMLWQHQNITLAMHSMAEYMATEMRANVPAFREEDNGRKVQGVISGSVINGFAWVQEQLVVARWSWLALPVLLLVLAALSLQIAYVETRRSHVGLWLSSPLTLFFQGRLVPEMQSLNWQVRSLDSAKAMSNAAEGLVARISTGPRMSIQVSSKSPASEDMELISRDSFQVDES